MSWKEILHLNAAALDDRGRVIMPEKTGANVSSAQGASVMALSHYSVLEISGPDTRKFLQGQLTCDMQALTAQHALAGALCTPKGRMVSNFYLQQCAKEALLMILPKATLQATRTTLEKYIVFSKAEIDVEQQRLLVGLTGEKACEFFHDVIGAVPEQRLAVARKDNISALCVCPQQQRYLLTVPANEAAEHWKVLADYATPVASNVWDCLDIRAGFGFVQEQTIEMFIPQMLNLQLTDGVSFTKGCYTGQEIVSRTQYRGNLKRRMYRLSGKIATAPAPGTTIFSHTKEQPIGNVVDAVLTTQDRAEMLAVLALSESKEESLLLGDKQGPELILEDLPYHSES